MPSSAPPPSKPRRRAAASRPPAAAARAKAPPAAWKRVARPDAIDFRDRVYVPPLGLIPPAALFPPAKLPVEDQGGSYACTGFALAAVANLLLQRAGREARPRVAPFMLYSMARRYDEFPGWTEDSGSSVRGALKGWFRHGVCAQALFPDQAMPPAHPQPEKDWWLDAVRRPLGAYARLDPQDLPALHAALAETGALLVSGACHAGWDALAERPQSARLRGLADLPVIERQAGAADHAGHAFALVGYDARGFVVQNSWGPNWGARGLALLPYEDWLENGWDCWVAQLGVVTATHLALASRAAPQPGAAGEPVRVAADPVLRDRELSPHVINTENNGRLSRSGRFRTQPEDVQALFTQRLPDLRQAWGLKPRDAVDVALYAHGGLVGEGGAADTASRWIPRMLAARILPIFLMWETDLLSTLKNLLEDALRGQEGRAGGGLERWWNTRLERSLSRPGTQVWGEMKQNAEALSRPREGAADAEQPGLVQLARAHAAAGGPALRLHLVGHSAGSIVLSHLLPRLKAMGLPVESISFMAPAVRVDVFRETVLPALQAGEVGRFQTFHLDDKTEEDDSVAVYRRSLLLLLRESFEGGRTTPILGLERDWRALQAELAGAATPVQAHVSPGPLSRSVKHGGFDDDDTTLDAVLRFIRPQA